MAVAAKGNVVGVHFGHAKEFLVYEAAADGVRFVGHRKVEQYCAGNETCGDAESVLERSIHALGEHAMEPVEDAVMAVWREMLAAGKLEPKPSAAKCA